MKSVNIKKNKESNSYGRTPRMYMNKYLSKFTANPFWKEEGEIKSRSKKNKKQINKSVCEYLEDGNLSSEKHHCFINSSQVGIMPCPFSSYNCIGGSWELYILIFSLH